MKYGKREIEAIQALDSRTAVGYALERLHREDGSITAVYADVGSRFALTGRLGADEIEIGIAEQTLVPLLGGLAHEGRVPFGIAYAPFITMRAADQIRMTVGEMKLNVKLVGGSAGLVSGNLGAASLALDDISMMRAIPNIVIMSPSDGLSEVKLFELAAKCELPVYIRLTGGKLPVVYPVDIDITMGKGIEVYASGRDAVVYATGTETARAVEAAKELNRDGIRITVIDMLFIKPVDTEILHAYSDIHHVFTVEEHNVIGGLGSAVSEYISANTMQCVTRIGVQDTYMYPDTYEKLVRAARLDADSIASTIKNKLR